MEKDNPLKQMRKGYLKQLKKELKFNTSKNPKIKKIIDKLTK
tara:strand:+ start:2783 stop:2908 length:126 start_codon:yes stop_codon:yes gene_type:complete